MSGPSSRRYCEGFSFDSGGEPYLGSMLTAKPHKRRFLEAIQFVLTLASTCAVAETIRIHSPPDDRPGYYASIPLDEARADRRLGDLARAERKRREAELKQASEQRQLRA